MDPLVPYIWASGVVHLMIATSNLGLPKVLGYRANLVKVSPIVRQIFIVHSAYVVLNLIAFAGLCLFFAPELAGRSSLGMALSAYMGGFWLLRFFIQTFYYDAELKRQHPVANVVFALAVLYMGGVATAAALGVGK